MPAIRSTLFALVFYGWTVIAVLLSFPISLLGTGAIRGWAHGWLRFHRWCAAWLLGIIVDLLTIPGFYDIALRDFGLLVAAVGRRCGPMTADSISPCTPLQLAHEGPA